MYLFLGRSATTPTVPNQADISEPTMTIVAFWDSLTAGLGVALDESYPSILEKRLNETLSVRVINMWVSGETTTGGMERAAFVIQQKPNLVLLWLWANDMLRGTNPDITRWNIEKIIQTFQENNIPVILLWMRSQASNGPLFQEAFDSIYPDLATKYSLPLVPFFLEGVALIPELNTQDGIHPNKAGYEKIVSENILPILIPYLSKE